MNTKRLLQITAIVALTSCAARSGSPDAEWNGGAETSGEIRIDVLNHNFSDATIWAVIRESSRRRLGVVTGKTDETYVLEWDFTQPLRLEIDLLAGSRCLTRPIDVDPGDILQLEIQAVFRDTDFCENR